MKHALPRNDLFLAKRVLMARVSPVATVRLVTDTCSGQSRPHRLRPARRVCSFLRAVCTGCVCVCETESSQVDNVVCLVLEATVCLPWPAPCDRHPQRLLKTIGGLETRP